MIREKIATILEQAKSNKLEHKTIWWIIFSSFLFIWTIQENPPTNKNDLHYGLWSVMLMQAKDLTNNEFLQNIPYGYNRALRLTVPVIIKIFSITSQKQLYIIQLLVSFVFQLLLVKLVYRINKGHIINTILFCLACTYCYFSNTATGDLFGHADTFGFFFILLAIYTNNPFVVFVSMLAAIFTNERTLIIAVPPVWFWWILSESPKKKMMIFGAMPLAVLGYFVGKYYMLSFPNFKMSLPNDFSLLYLISQHSFFSMYVFSFKGLWVFVFYLVYQFKKLPLYLLLSLFFSTAAFVVADQTRGISFLFPLFILVLSQLNKVETTETIKKLSIYCLIASIVIPNIVFYGDHQLRPSLLYIALEKLIFTPVEAIVSSLIHH